MLLVDTNVSHLLPFVRQLSDDGFSPAALVITHRHVVGLGDALSDLKAEFKIPLLLHPIDAKHKQEWLQYFIREPYRSSSPK